ncbi:protein of unknown function DUF485 [Beutenbergia cavernae DSM 12333]|uniref:Uncharacterized protein n=1 Tax=Beutenbergia cavernae (strain ATCC BAA-8 / DSM 12333 / CCUG 43141 / JCM 11478 / NBRC 16432 / NCIMB 13614 / HKI 0122) TaxID=471853 RepID=C5C1K8_BEUC1|nr:DUF485 domain-containing protein [Beutenbergia cavernae]ACQ81618.1 protein of unknown function DUF485 [Beutenbergia cavernae DSM 12333]
MNQRVTVTGPRRHPARARRRAATADIDEQTHLGDVYMRSLVRTQLRLGLTVAGVTFGLLAALPLVFALAPETAQRTVLGIGMPWLILGAGVYPLLVGVAWIYVRQAERVERDFAELVDRR